MILENFKHTQGKSCRTVAIRDILERCGLTVKEEFVFGLAGGLSFSYVDPGGIFSENRFFKVLAPNLMQFEHFAQNAGVDYRIVFLDCRDEILERRYNETRRRHPLSDDIATGIRMEREMLAELRDRASVIIDTTNMRPLELGTALERELNMGSTGFMLRVMSFGYKRGVPFEADIVLDMRFSSNPYYDKELRPLCGKDKAIRDYVMADKDVREFMDNVESMLYRLIPRFIEQDKRRLVVAFGCTGGRHRSVCAAEELYNRIKGRYNAVLTHRDLTIEGSDIKERTGDKS